MTEHIIVADEESTRTITMRRPEKKNTLTQDMYLAMSDAIDTAQSNPEIRCLILTGRSGVMISAISCRQRRQNTMSHGRETPSSSCNRS
jgi:enoyl-CoA hydratase/carnithine racemase